VVSWRYHAASLVAVFLALAIGVAAGGLILHGAVVSDLHRQVRRAEAERTQARAAAMADRAQASAAQGLLAAATTRLLAGRLAGRAVLLISTPGTTDALRRPLTTALASAGARVVGDIRLSSVVDQPASGPLLSDVTTSLTVAGLNLPTDERAALLTVLAAATAGAQPAGDPRAVLAALRTAGIAEIGTRTDGPAAAVVVLAPPGGSDQRAASLAGVIAGAYTSRGAYTVVAASGAAPQSLAAIRSMPSLAAKVSTVARADLPSGPLAVVLALAGQLNGKVGQYGGPGETGETPPL
jgi:hypothetical protein